MKEFYRNFRKKLESYLEKRHSKKVAQALERFYEENFADQDYEDPMKGVGVRFMSPPDRVLNDLEEGIKKIPEEAERLNLPVIEVAGFCFHRLLSNAIRENFAADTNVSSMEGDETKREFLERYMEEYGEALGKDEAAYKAAMVKIEACEEIAENFNLGEDAIEISKRNVERVKRKMNMAKTIRQTFDGDKYEGTGNADKALKAFDELREMAGEQSERMVKEKKALLEQDVKKWKAGS